METNTQPEQNINVSAEASQPAGLSLRDLSIMSNIITIATSRGAFKADELSSVGAVFDKLTAFLAAVAEQQKPAESKE